ncbi:hypothetical protein QZH41_009879 [Actinostola sp. cb2023]|nr:hypothetical protein QZH41_009879 [Actinostola sp. cb2023]
MASDGLLFKPLSYIHPKTEVPIIATIVSGLLAAFLALIFELQELVEMMSIGTLLAYTVVAICVLLLRYKPGSIGVTMNVLSELNMVPSGTTQERMKLLNDPDTASAPTDETYRKAAICVCVESILFIFAGALAIWGGRALLEHQGWAVFLACLIGVLILVTALYLALARKKFIDPKTIGNTQLSRCLSILDLTALGVGSTLGAGVYVVAAEIARDVAGPAAIISFLIAGIASVLSGLCYAEFGARVPKTGSAYVYSYVTIGEIVAFVIGWNLVLEYMIGAAAISRAWSAYFDSMLQDRIRTYIVSHVGTIQVGGLGNYPDLIAFSICLLITLIQLTGVKKSTRFIGIITCVNIGVIGVIIGVGATIAEPKNWDNFMPYGTSGVLAGSATAFFAFVGFDVIATTGEEAKNPSKSIPIAIVISLLVCFTAYVGVTAAITLIVPYNELQYGAALPKAFAQRGAGFAQYVIAIGALCGMTAAINGGLFPLPRLLYAMASDGLIFKYFSYVSKSTEVPLVGTLFSGLLAGILAMLFELQELVEMMSIGTLQAYTIVSTCVLILRYQPDSIGITLDKPQDSDNEGSETPSRKEPTHKTGKIIRYTVASLFVYFFILSSFLIYGMVSLFNGEAWAIASAVVLSLALIVALVIIARQPQSKSKIPFKVPLLPWLPIVSMFINIYLMMELSSVTWVRFCIWMVVGMAIYFFYGIHHSVEGERQKEQGNYIPLEQVDTAEQDEDAKDPPAKQDEDKPKEDDSEDKKDEKFPPSS